jgi:hypothetical protein
LFLFRNPCFLRMGRAALLKLLLLGRDFFG